MPIARSDKEKRLLEKAARYLPGATLGNVRVTPESAFVIREGRGSKVYDFSGNEYIDYLLGSGPMILGHAHPNVVSAVRDYLERGSTYFANNAPAIELAEEIVQAVPCAEKVRFTTSGTDAVFQCIRLARAFRNRDKILKFEGGYHGSSDYAMMSQTPQHPRDFPTPTPNSAGIPKCIQEQVLIAPFNDLDATTSIIGKYHEELAAVLAEPFQRVIPPKPGFLKGLREITAHYQIPLIFDEVVTGFRFAYSGAQEYYGVVPDLAAFGKIMGGGFPLAAICGRGEIMRLYDHALEGTEEFIPQVGTLSGNPVSAVAGLATLRELKKKGTYEKLHATGTRLMKELARLLKEAGIVAQVVGHPTVFNVFFAEEEIDNYRATLKNDKQKTKTFNTVLREQGVLKGAGKFYISLAHSPEDVNKTIASFSIAMEALQK